MESITPKKSHGLDQPDIPTLSFWQAVNADAIANGGKQSWKRTMRLSLMHPGFQLLLIHRIQSRLRQWSKGFEWLANIILSLGTYLTACHIYPDVTFEEGIHLPHATGIVIGKGAVIRSGVTIYQNVTLGRRTSENSGCPELQQNCTIYAGAQILGNIVVGSGATVGANSVVLDSVPDTAVVVGIPARVLDK